jgi:hypothetical protein
MTLGLQPAPIIEFLLNAGAAVSYEVPLDRAGRDVPDVVAFLGPLIYIVEVKPHVAGDDGVEQIRRYIRRAMIMWPHQQVYGFLVAPEFRLSGVPHGHIFLQRWSPEASSRHSLGNIYEPD